MKVLVKLCVTAVHRPELCDGWLSSDVCGYQIIAGRDSLVLCFC